MEAERQWERGCEEVRWYDALRFLLISQVGVTIGLMAATVEALRDKERAKRVGPAPASINVLFAVGVLVLVLTVARAAYSQLGLHSISPLMLLGFAGTTILMAGTFALLWHFRR